MKEIRYDAPGPCLIMAWTKSKQTEEVVQSVFNTLFQPDRMDRGPREGWQDPAWVAVRRNGVLAGTHLPMVDHWWSMPGPGVPLSNEMMFTYYIDARTPASGAKIPNIVIDGYRVLQVWGYHCQVPADDPRKIEDVEANFRKVVNAVQPPFAIIDHYTMNVKKRLGKDLRGFAWGVTIYGPELVKAIGRGKIQSAPAWKVEELPWGGIWLQAAENPFAPGGEGTKAIEKHLSLKNGPFLFAERGAHPTVKHEASRVPSAKTR